MWRMQCKQAWPTRMALSGQLLLLLLLLRCLRRWMALRRGCRRCSVGGVRGSVLRRSVLGGVERRRGFRQCSVGAEVVRGRSVCGARVRRRRSCNRWSGAGGRGSRRRHGVRRGVVRRRNCRRCSAGGGRGATQHRGGRRRLRRMCRHRRRAWEMLWRGMTMWRMQCKQAYLIRPKRLLPLLWP